MALVKPVVFQIVGYQNSGKTTLMIEMVKQLSLKGFDVTTIKHHGHGGKPDLAEKKDSSRHVHAGALASLIEGDGRILVQAEKADWNLEEQINLLSVLSPDLILIEGYKHESFPKALLIRDERDLHLLQELNQIKVVYCRKLELLPLLEGLCSCPVFVQAEETLKWITQYIQAEIS